LFTFLALTAVFLSACGGSNQPAARPLYSGSDGVIMSFPDTNALTQYQNDEFTISLRLLNDGTADITPQNPGFVTATFDASVMKAVAVFPDMQEFTQEYTTATSTTQQGGSSLSSQIFAAFGIPDIEQAINIFNAATTAVTGNVGVGTPSSGYARTLFSANGRSQYVSVGDIEFVEFTFQAQPLPANRATMTTPLVIQACYPYTTTFITEMCVDRDPLSSAGSSACQAQTLTAQPQGAPIAVRSVAPRYTRLPDRVEARYEIVFDNVRDGVVILPQKDQTSVQACNLGTIDRATYGSMLVTAQISGTKLKCSQDGTEEEGVTRFDKRRATIVCRATGDDAVGAFQGNGNYVAPIIIQAHYFYIQSMTAQVEVIKP
jgi:hypothetical protein